MAGPFKMKSPLKDPGHGGAKKHKHSYSYLLNKKRKEKKKKTGWFGMKDQGITEALDAFTKKRNE